jgi:hypothetical protein
VHDDRTVGYVKASGTEPHRRLGHGCDNIARPPAPAIGSALIGDGAELVAVDPDGVEEGDQVVVL